MANLPSVQKFIQQEETARRDPVSESLVQKVGGSINFILDNAQGLAVGSFEFSILTEAQYQAINGSGFIVADGRSVVGSAFNIITGMANVPDTRAKHLRMRSYGSGVNPDGDTVPGTVQAGLVKLHTHSVDFINPFLAGFYDTQAYKWPSPPLSRQSGSDPGGMVSGAWADIFVTIGNSGTGGGETNCIIGNWFIRIN